MAPDVELLYLQHLGEQDRQLIARAAGPGATLDRALGHPDLETLVFGPAGPEGVGEAFRLPSPFLTFAVAVHRTAARLERASFVEERWSRRRIPVFDVGSLRELLGSSLHRYFLVELLASYTRVSSGVTWTRTARGWRRRRFSELDPVRLAGLLEVVDPDERAGVYRRLGDLALFLTGVFPDHGAATELGGVQGARLLRLSGLSPSRSEELSGAALLEHLGPRWYRLAAASVVAAGLPQTATLTVAEEMGERFTDARRALNLVADNFLFPLRARWFGIG